MFLKLNLWVLLPKRHIFTHKGGMEDPLLYMDSSRLKESENSSEEDISSEEGLSPSIEDIFVEPLSLTSPIHGYEDPIAQHERIADADNLSYFRLPESVEGSVFTATGVDKSLEETLTSKPSLPEFEQLLPAGSPKSRQRSKSPKKTPKRAFTISSSPGTHPVTKRRHILPKTPVEVSHSQSTSGSTSPSSLESILSVFQGETSISDSPSIATSVSPAVSVELETDKSPVDPQPGPSGEQGKRPSDIPLTFDSSSSASSSQGSPTLAATTEEVVKVFVYEEDEGVKKAAVASEQSKSFMPLIKEELRTKIQLKRLLSGDEEAEVEFKKPDFKMSLDEVKKRERKKEQNRRAALKSRQRQSQQEEDIIQKHSQQEKKRKELVKERQRLLEEKKRYMDNLKRHIDTECQLETREEDAVTLHQLQESSTQTQLQ